MPLGSPILSNRYHTVHRIEGGVLWVVRSAEEFDSADAIVSAASALGLALAPSPRAKTAVVVDLRQARGRSDPTFEEVWAPLRRELFRGWAAVAVICQTEVGRMHVQRHMREDGLDWHVVTDRDDAMAFAAAAVS